MYKKFLLLIICVIGFLSSVLAANWNLPGVNIITRAQWGADETWRYTSLSKTERDKLRKQKAEDEGYEQSESEYKGKIATDYLISLTPEEQKVDEYRESSDGNYLKWPESIHKHKIKIIIHHTATDYTAVLTGGTGAAIQELQAIYKYHTLTKGWGDIGYHFIIDPFGTIYEGKAGGPGVVGAHTAWNNTPSIGISLMGNFNDNVPTDASLKSLVSLTTALAKKYSINPKNTATYFKKSDEYPYLSLLTNYTIVGHRDAGVTSCPGTNLYNFLPELREQVSKNLSSFSLISTSMGKVKSSLYRGSIVAGRYYSDLTTDTFELPIRRSGVKSCTTKDTTITINSCTSVGNHLIISLTKKGTSGIKTISAVTASGMKTFSMNLIRKNDFDALANGVKKEYITRKGINFSLQNTTKITSKIFLEDVKTLINTPLTILLYELSMNYPRYDVSCDGGCTINADSEMYSSTHPAVEVSNGFIYLRLPDIENPVTVQNLEIYSKNGGLVSVTNYARKSYAGTPWNTFRGSLIRKKETVKNLRAGTYVDQAVVMNKTSFDNYMHGIAETSDADNIVKQKTILLLAKMYALFYINGKNTHPSIPAGVSYQAIDHPDMFQKYVGAGREKTSKMSASLLEDIQNKFVFYEGYVPILPYFTCSAGFTRSAQEKRGRFDTPYLQSKLDFAPCFEFNGHGVGLSGKGAQYLAEKGWTLEQILQYYYPGVELITNI